MKHYHWKNSTSNFCFCLPSCRWTFKNYIEGAFIKNFKQRENELTDHLVIWYRLRCWEDSDLKFVICIYRKAHLCAEILSINNEELSKAVISNEEACSLLLDFLDSRKLNHVIVNFYMKIFSQIISRFPDQVYIPFFFFFFVIICKINSIHGKLSFRNFRLFGCPLALVN